MRARMLKSPQKPLIGFAVAWKVTVEKPRAGVGRCRPEENGDPPGGSN
jgi:hypothetical protein